MTFGRPDPGRWLPALPALPALLALVAVAAWTAGIVPAPPAAGNVRFAAAPLDAAVLIEGLTDRATGADPDGRRTDEGGPPSSPGSTHRSAPSAVAGPRPTPGLEPVDGSHRRLERAGRTGHPGTGPPSSS